VRTRSLAWKAKTRELVTTGRRQTRPSLRDGFNGFLRARPGDRACCLRRQRIANLISASGYQAHTTSPSAFAPFVNAPPKRPSHPAPNVRDDRDTPLFSGAGWREVLEMICPTGKVKYFYPWDWTVDSALIGFMKLDFWRNLPILRTASKPDQRSGSKLGARRMG
jgi:hypothetical protein